MKKMFFYAMLALGMTAACQKPDVEVENPDLDDNSPVEVVFGVKAPTITVTKTKAAVEDWKSQTVYVYGFADDVTAVSDGTALIYGEGATVGTVSDSDPDAADESGLTFGNSKKFYYQVDDVYDFYAYYTGKEEDVTATGRTLTADVTITGAEDVMIAKTDKATDIANRTSEKTLNESRVYSAYAARRGVHPTLVFEHKLTRFVFKVVKGETPSAADHTADVNVTGISIESYNTGKLDITGNTFTATTTGGKTWLNSVITDDAYTPTEDADDSEGMITDLMVFPGDAKMNLKVALEPANAEGNSNLEEIVIDPMEVVLDAAKIAGTEGATFEAGKKYVVTITVYSLEEVQVSASLTEWVEGGETTYDPDEEWDAAA